ncbi:MAG TPA: NapC/NirT family cytochrome c [Terriglobales bacterium]|jgi:nitrate/TMAO reductase-like tetraheme cytochrome c subunit|nr:NapC/NirT family cytochrome c [Terriglobales bacterium]
MTEDTQKVDPLRDHPPVSKGLIKNPISLIGVALAVVAFANILFLVLIDILSSQPAPYLGVLAYMVAPTFLIVGLILIPIGMVIERRRRLRNVGAPFHFARLDLNNPAQRSTVAFVLSFVVAFTLISAVGSYKAYEFTDSIQFCGQLCHTVMHPEFTAYQASPHARVACVDCHVGSGASWYVKSKLSGARQVYYTALGTYPRPIPTPVANLRPAPQTCEQCHWPKKFWGAQLKVFTHYGSDEQNTPRVIRMLIKTGGGDSSLGQVGGGIHWHMNINNKITYFATDEQRQTIPWVRIEDAQGNVTEYTTKDNPPTQAQIDKASKRRMDCIDCHNRPTHIYVAPDLSVDRSMTGHTIDASLPFIKQQGVQVLTADYKTTADAEKAIADDINKFYQGKYPQLTSSKVDSIKGSIAELQRIYRTTFFPDMKVNWKTHPNNIGHFYFPGCFRCHDGNHVSKDGKVISKDCNSCHTVLDQEEGGAHLAPMASVSFKHPVDIGDLSSATCSDCHNGGVGP